MADASSRRRRQREVARAVRERRRILPQAVTNRARQAATAEMQRRRREEGYGGGSPPASLKSQVIQRKQSFFRDDNFHSSRSARYVYESDAEDEMNDFLEMGSDEARSYARQAALAWQMYVRTGIPNWDDIAWDFLFYH